MSPGASQMKKQLMSVYNSGGSQTLSLKTFLRLLSGISIWATEHRVSIVSFPF